RALVILNERSLIGFPILAGWRPHEDVRATSARPPGSIEFALVPMAAGGTMLAASASLAFGAGARMVEVASRLDVVLAALLGRNDLAADRRESQLLTHGVLIAHQCA